MHIGLEYKAETFVTEDKTARAMQSGSLDVFATPAMIALVERAAAECVEPYLAAGESTVGILVNIKHTAPTTIGQKVSAVLRLTEIDGKRLVFDAKVFDSQGSIGSQGNIGCGTHERFIINSDKFMKKAESKYKSE